MALKIYKNASGFQNVFTELLYTTDNIETIEIKKYTPVMQFGLPVVDKTIQTSGSLGIENMEYIHMNGCEGNIQFSFTAPMSDITTIYNIVGNKMSTTNMIVVDDWQSETSGYCFVGLLNDLRMRQNGGEPTLTIDMGMILGTNPVGDLGGI